MFQKVMQTDKVDVWALFVTMLWTLDLGEFRQNSKSLKSPGEAHVMILSMASNEDAVSKIREMACLSPAQRASAAQML
ncbi:hypothetical protein A1O1_01466 [Capronia coronata CBS 617.96]|uniref:Protein kinase domain-containing protein n=1 Tax=Capronia coronata CBS 617.96 TaxID=1182541 RepID=W9Z324_9EURO|nr:uncharacterized protein A1O1_01466 [Capronia coronata CBS 617.96]EXJ96340.1 hypothetical protein A1O1_01466 [Capronia coronata CBS 617.96]